MDFDHNENIVQNAEIYGGEADKKLLDMIEQAMKCSETSAELCKSLMLHVDNTHDRNIIKNIYLDEMKHYKYFQDIYFRITKSRPVMTRIAPQKIKPELCDNFYDGFINKINEIEFDRKIYFSFIDANIRDILFEILTDKQNHALCFNLLYAKYS